MGRSKPPVDAIWTRIKESAGERFHTKTGKPFEYEIAGDVFMPSRTKYNIQKRDFAKALALVPIDGPGRINAEVRGPAYVWAVLHDERIRQDDW
jgi:hypothetical protein